jgi:hypothetical protein
VDDYLGILAVDVSRFSKHNSSQQATIMPSLSEIIQHAARRAQVVPMWEEATFCAPRGDGFLIGFRRNLLSHVVDKFFDALQTELRRRSARFRADGVVIRVRAGLGLGPVPSFNPDDSDSPSGDVVLDANRMVDAPQVRILLEKSDPDVTFVAVVLSRSVMEHVVAAGGTLRKPSEFVETTLRVPGKDYEDTGYLRVPAPSGSLLTAGLLFEQHELAPEAVAEENSAPEDQMRNSATGPVDNVLQARDVYGGIRSQSATGDNNTIAGRDIDQSSHKQEISGTFRTQGDTNFGSSSGRRSQASGDQAGQ